MIIILKLNSQSISAPYSEAAMGKSLSLYVKNCQMQKAKNATANAPIRRAFMRLSLSVTSNSSRHHHYINIQPMSEYKDASDYFQKCCVAFCIARHQDNHWQRKIN